MNISNEWYAKDMSRKMKAAYKLKDGNGYAFGHPPLGYKYDTVDKKRWVIDEEGGAEIVRNIYNMRLNGHSVVDIARILRCEKVLIPSQYAMEKGIRKASSIKEGFSKYLWTNKLVRVILTNQSYVGDVVNHKTSSVAYKLKKDMITKKKIGKFIKMCMIRLLRGVYGRAFKKHLEKQKLKFYKYPYASTQNPP